MSSYGWYEKSLRRSHNYQPVLYETLWEYLTNFCLLATLENKYYKRWLQPIYKKIFEWHKISNDINFEWDHSGPWSRLVENGGKIN